MTMQWRHISASIDGPKHIAQSRAGQDHHEVRRLSEIRVCMALDDGAGSTEYGGEGAKIAVSSIVQGMMHAKITSENSSSVFRHLMRTAKADVLCLARKNKQPVNNYASTLLAVFLTETQTYVMQCGDGAIGAILDDGTVSLLTYPTHGEYSTQTSLYQQ